MVLGIKMDLKKMFIVFIIAFSSNTNALDKGDIGEYAVIHKDGHVTNKIFRVAYTNDNWKIEDRKIDGSWEGVTCEKYCILSNSTEQEVELFMGGKPPKNMSTSCIHNREFAFCSVTKSDEKIRKYLFLVITQNPAIAINLQPLRNSEKKP